MKRINLIFACIIASGVVYNSARISLAERSRELATLRVIGFTRHEISAILLGELAIVTLLALPLGMVLGKFFAWWMCTMFDQELFRFPLVVNGANLRVERAGGDRRRDRIRTDRPPQSRSPRPGGRAQAA